MQRNSPTSTLIHGTFSSPELTRSSHTVSDADARARRSGGPQDKALYRCGCGHAFKAEVSTSVGCPHCGTGQAW